MHFINTIRRTLRKIISHQPKIKKYLKKTTKIYGKAKRAGLIQAVTVSVTLPALHSYAMYHQRRRTVCRSLASSRTVIDRRFSSTIQDRVPLPSESPRVDEARCETTSPYEAVQEPSRCGSRDPKAGAPRESRIERTIVGIWSAHRGVSVIRVTLGSKLTHHDFPR